jgi:electron transfer flavoprotein alpha subunit
MATLQPGTFQPAEPDPYRSGEIEQVAVALDGVVGKLKWVDWDTAVTPPPIPLAQSRVIVAAGRGLKHEKGFALAQQLAAALGGQVAGSRGALDEGWIDEEQQVGLTGQTVRPDLYVACGVSGAIQHVLGMQEAGFVVAINRDDQAPMMKTANLAVVGDAEEVLEALVEELTGASKE